MKSREGVKGGEERTFGPKAPAGTRWALLRDAREPACGWEQQVVTAPTAFLACASIGWAMSELVLPPKKVT